MKKRIFNIVLGLLFCLLAILLFEHDEIESLERFYSGYGFLKIILVFLFKLIGQIATILVFFGLGTFLIILGLFNIKVKLRKNQ